MSPEQARGKPLDRRADVWAFGCILYEMLSGRRAFPQGETVSDTLAKVLEREPNWHLLPPVTPSTIRTLLARCLRKDVRRRLYDMAEARIEIEEARGERTAPAAQPAVAVRATRREYVLGTVVVVLLLTTGRFGCGLC
jgi:serine/threonine protein kinase